MTHISFTNFVCHTNLSQQRLAYFGDCSICHEENSEAISLHLTEQEPYNPTLHGQVALMDKIYGVYKRCAIARSENFEVKTAHEYVFHEIGYDKNKTLHLYAPLHTACRRCLDRLKSEKKPVCPLCRMDLKDLCKNKKKSTKTKPEASSTTAREIRQEQIAAIRARPDLELGTHEIIFSQGLRRAYHRSPAFTRHAIALTQDLSEAEIEHEQELGTSRRGPFLAGLVDFVKRPQQKK